MSKIENVKEAARIIGQGGVVVYPTETVYGLGADALNPKAIQRVIRLKERPGGQPISVAVASLEMLERIAYPEHRGFLERWLPGPVTVLLRKKPVVPDLLTGSSSLVGIRIPDHPLALDFIGRTGPITSTSANKSGKPAPRSAEEVEIEADYLLDGGQSKYGEPSTVIDLTTFEVLRRGAMYDEVNRWVSAHTVEQEG